MAHFSGTKDAWELIVYSVFGDESYDKGKKRVFTVGGIFGSREDWDNLADEWVKRTKGKVFHAAACESDLEDFAGIDHKENLRLYADLTTLLIKTKMLGYTVSIDLAGYREFFPNVNDSNDPYYFCFHEIIFKFATITALSIPQDKVEFTFDHNFEIEFTAARLYDHMLHLPEWEGKDLLAKQIIFAYRENPKIQAADLVAREGMKDMENKIRSAKRVRRSMIALKRTGRFAFIQLGREFFRTLQEKAHLLKDMPGAKMSEYRNWLKKNKLQENTSTRIQYQNHIDALERIQRPAQTE